MSDVPIYYAFARSGGTLLNRCLGCISDNLVLSEVNPHCCVKSVEEQARDWFGLIDGPEFLALQRGTYAEKILAVQQKAASAGKRLIIRDWCYVNFLGGISEPSMIQEPSGVLEQPLYLETVGIRLRPVVFARRAAGIFASKIFVDLPLPTFGPAYLAYARAVCGLPVYRYEEFCADPSVQFERICNALSVSFSPSFLQDFCRFENCTGDNVINRANPSAPVHLERIAAIPPPRNDPRYLAASQDPDCREADRLLGYEN